MSVKAYFLSDLHLGSVEEPNAFVLLNFLKNIKSTNQMTHLFLLGDIFDLWIADHEYFKNKFKPIVDEWMRLHALGIKIHYFEGNHDLYLKNYFEKQLGFKVHEGPYYGQLGAKTVRIEHGDQMDPDDKGYLFLRWLLRTSFLKWLAPRLPSSFVVWLGQRMSRASRKYTSQVKVISNDRAKRVIFEHAHRAWQEKPFDLLLSGHIHVVEDSTVSMGTTQSPVRIVNLGAWFDKPRVFVFSDQQMGFQELV